MIPYKTKQYVYVGEGKNIIEDTVKYKTPMKTCIECGGYCLMIMDSPEIFDCESCGERYPSHWFYETNYRLTKEEKAKWVKLVYNNLCNEIRDGYKLDTVEQHVYDKLTERYKNES